VADYDGLNKAIDHVVSRFTSVNRTYVQKIAEQISKIGHLTQSTINWLIIMQEMNQDIADITQQLAVATNQSITDVMQIYEQAMNMTYTDPRFQSVVENKPMSDSQKRVLANMARSYAIQTAQTLLNYSNTTAISQTYRTAVDNGIMAVSSGLTDYNAAMRDIVRDLGSNGMQVTYASGYHRRLDSAVRQNIVDGVNQLAQEASLRMGEIYGDAYDAIELSAHAMSAPDHEPVQGRVFLKAEFEKLQSGDDFQDINGKQYPGMRRAIGQWNCKHIAMSFSTKYNKPRYTEEQLQEWEATNQAGVTINGKHYTVYEASQLMRELETRIRQQKDIAVAAQGAGDDTLRRDCQLRINKLSAMYQAVARQAGMRPQMNRTTVVGFKPYKIK